MKIERRSCARLALKKGDYGSMQEPTATSWGAGMDLGEQIDPCITQIHVFRASPYLASEVDSKFVSYWGNTFGKFNTEGKQTTNLA